MINIQTHRGKRQALGEKDPASCSTCSSAHSSFYMQACISLQGPTTSDSVLCKGIGFGLPYPCHATLPLPISPLPQVLHVLSSHRMLLSVSPKGPSAITESALHRRALVLCKSAAAADSQEGSCFCSGCCPPVLDNTSKTRPRVGTWQFSGALEQGG